MQDTQDYDRKPLGELDPIDFYRAKIQKGGITSNELLRKEFVDPPWTADGLIPEGFTLLVGKPKTGKSWLALQIAAAVSVGLPALGQYKTTKGNVLYLSLEDTERRLRNRFDTIKGFGSDNLLFYTEWERGLGGVRAIAKYCEDFPDTRLIVIDTASRFFPGVDLNDATETTEALTPLKQLCDKYSVTIILIHHTRKSIADDFIDTAAGSYAMTAIPDTTMALTRGRGIADGYLRATGRDMDEKDIALELVKDEGWKVLGDGAEYRMSKERREIVELLEEAGEPLSPKDIASMLDHTYGNTRTTLMRMVNDGQVYKFGRGLYAYKEQ